MPPPWKQVVPVVALFGAYGAYVLRDRLVLFVRDMYSIESTVLDIKLATRAHVPGRLHNSHPPHSFDHHYVIQEEAKEERRQKRRELLEKRRQQQAEQEQQQQDKGR